MHEGNGAAPEPLRLNGCRLNLRGYQDYAAQQVRLGWAHGNRRIVLYAPTGAGKTEIALGLIAHEIHSGGHVLMTVDRVTLLDQTITRARAASIKTDWYHEKRCHPDAPLIVTTPQTLDSRGSLEDLPWKPTLIVVDECHVDHKWNHRETRVMARRQGVRVLGLSATPISAGPLSRWDLLVNAATQADLEKRGLLVRPRVLRLRDSVGFDAHAMDGVARDVAGEYTDEGTARAMVRFTPRIARSVGLQVSGMPEVPRILVFGATIPHATALVKAIAEEVGCEWRTVTARTKKRERREAVGSFADGSVRVLGSVSALTTGFDIPSAEVLVVARPLAKSVTAWIQMLGRVCRAADGKSDARVLDFVGNAGRFELPAAVIRQHGVSALPPYTRKPGPAATWGCKECGNRNPLTVSHCETCGKPRKKAGGERPCPNCGKVMPLSVLACPDCGFVYRATDAETCPQDGMPLVIRDPSSPLQICPMPGCGYTWDPEAGEAAERAHAAAKRTRELLQAHWSRLTQARLEFPRC